MEVDDLATFDPDVAREHASSADARPAHPVRVTAAIALGVAAMAMMQTISIPLLPALPQVFDTSIASVSWVATSTLIVGAVSNPIIGRMGDMYGKRNLLLVCLSLAIAGSVIGAAANSLVVLVFARALQGIGSGVIPLGYGIVRDEVSAKHLPRAVSVITAAGLGLGAGLGPVVMGWVLATWGWRAVLVSTVAVCAAALPPAVLLIPTASIRFPARFDWLGAIGLSGVLVALLLGITKGAEWGWTSGWVAGLFVVAALVGGWWFQWERRRDEPLVDVAVSVSGPVLLSHLGGLMVGVSIFTQYIVTFTLVSLPTATGYGLGESLTIAGLIHLPGAAVIAISVVAGARVTITLGAPRMLAIGSTIVAIGFAVGIIWHGSVGQLAAGVMVVNLGIGAAFAAIPLLIIDNVDVSETSAVNAVNALVRVIGSVLASAGVSAILATGAVLIGGRAYPAPWTFRLAYGLAAMIALTIGALAFRVRRAPR